MSARMVTLSFALLVAAAVAAQKPPPQTTTHPSGMYTTHVSGVVTPVHGGATVVTTVGPVAPPPVQDPQWLAGWETRETELQRLEAKTQLTDPERIALFQTLEHETSAMQAHYLATKEPLGEDYGAYYMDLVLFVTKLKDPRSIRALAGATDVGARVSTTLADFGEPAVDAVVATRNNPLLKSSAVYTLGKLLHGNQLRRTKLSPASITKIRGTLIEVGTTEKSPAVRRNVIDAVSHLPPDPELTRLLRTYDREPSAKRLLQQWKVQQPQPIR